jgi:uncharacterized protein (TIGR02996 family)
MTGADLLELVRAAPDDDGPRLLFADWCDAAGDPDRGEFVRVQLALARLSQRDRRRPPLVRREAELLAAHAARWADPLRGVASGPVFRRGFVDEVKATARQFAAHADALFALAPVRHLHLLDLGDHPSALRSRHLGKLHGLTVFAQRVDAGRAGDGRLVGELADSPHLAGLRVLRLGRNRIGDAGAARLAEADLRSLEELDLRENDLTDAAAGVVARAEPFAGLRRLELAGNRIGPAGAAAAADPRRLPRLDALGLASNALAGRAAAGDLLSRPIIDLSANGFDPANLQALLAAPGPAAVRDLDLGENPLGDAAGLLIAGSPRLAGLRTLRLCNAGLGDPGLAALATAPHVTRLTRLDVGRNPVGDEGLRAVLQGAALRGLRELAYPRIGVSFWMRQSLDHRFNRGGGN